jgi:two-component system, OmpR family, phosphate regulon response regulator PhoB
MILVNPFSIAELLARVRALLRRTWTEFRLLRLLMHSPNRVFSRGEIIDQVWGAGAIVELRTVDVHVRRLREAITCEGDPDVIRTVRATGYVLDAA